MLLLRKHAAVLLPAIHCWRLPRMVARVGAT